MLVVYERKKGNYHNLPAEWCEFIEKYSYLISEDTLILIHGLSGSVLQMAFTDRKSALNLLLGKYDYSGSISKR